MKVKFYITYFYNVRFLKPYQIPFSTAIWDPKWYHQNKGQDYVYKDENGVYNGLRIETLHPALDNDYCVDCDHSDKGDCIFIEKYRKQLNDTNFDLTMNFLNQTMQHIKNTEGFEEEPECVILVHEKPDNPCSERWSLIDWFKEHGIDLVEFKKED